MPTLHITPQRTLYRLVFSDGRTYVGVTKTPVKWRFSRHRVRSKEHTSKLYVAWRELGEPVMEVLAIVAEHMWAATERRAIEVLKPELNTDPGGTGAGKTILPETRAKLSAALSGVKKPARSAEYRANISRAQKGLKKPPMSAEHRAKLSAARKGRTVSAETRAKLSAAQVGKTHSAETRAKISAAKLGNCCAKKQK